MKINDLIKSLGGTTKTAEMVGVGKSAVSNWKAAGAIPARLGLRFQKICMERDIDFDESWFEKNEAA